MNRTKIERCDYCGHGIPESETVKLDDGSVMCKWCLVGEVKSDPL